MRVVVELIAKIRVARGAGRGLARSLILARARTRIGSLLRLVQIAAASVAPARIGAGLLAAIRGGRSRRSFGLRLIFVGGAAWILVVAVLSLLHTGGWINGSPAAIAPFAPVAIGVFLVDVAIGSRVDVVVFRVFRNEAAISVLGCETCSFAALRSLERADAAVSAGIVLRFGPVVSVGHDAVAPLSVLVVIL